MKEWYQRWGEALLVFAWGVGMFILGFVFARFVFQGELPWN